MTKIIKSNHGVDIIVDSDMYDKLCSMTWLIMKVQYNKMYAQTFSYKKGIRRSILMHRLVIGAKKGEIVDHINQNTLDNRRENLRLCTKSQNGFNRKKTAKNKSGYKGVTLHRNGLWTAELTCGGKRFRKNGFKTAKDAALAYNFLAIRHHGEFAFLNQID